MAIGKGIAKQLRVKRQPAKGTLATPGTGGQLVRRVTSNFNLAKDSYTTENEQTSTRQIMSARHGPKVVNGTLTGNLSPGTYSDPLSAILMRDFAAIPPITGLNITVAGAGPLYTITRDAGDWIADGAKIGRVGRLGGAFDAANVAKNVMIVGATALALTVFPLNRKALVAEGPIAAATFTLPGAVTFVPTSGHTDVYHTVEEFFSDIPRSQVNQDVKFHSATLRLPGSGNAGIDMAATGLDQLVDVSGPGLPYFVAPAPETTTDTLVAASGALFVNGVLKSVVTDATITIDGRGAAADPVVGDDLRPDVFTGILMASGSLTEYFNGGGLTDNFINEDNISFVMALTASKAGNADFMTINMGQVKLMSTDGDDPQVGMKRTYNFSAQYNRAGGVAAATNATTIEIQDSAVIAA
jgi:hypothetical protein